MDILIRFWHESKKHVVTQYLASEFLQGAKADQLVNKFNSVVETLDQSKLIYMVLVLYMNSMMKEIIWVSLILELVAYIQFMGA